MAYKNGLDWTTTERSDGRKIAYPKDWTKEEWIQWFRLTNYSDGTNKLELLFRELNYLPLLEEYEELFTDSDEFADFVFYTFLNLTIDDGITTSYSLDLNNSPTNYAGSGGYVTEIKCWINSHKTFNNQCACDAGYIWIDQQSTTNLDCKLIIPTTPVPAIKKEWTSFDAADILWILWYITLQNSAKEYNLESHILRQEIVSIVVKMKKITLPTDYFCTNKFADVSTIRPNTWVCRTAEIAAQNGIISSDNKKFNPETNVSTSEAIAMVLNALDYKYQWFSLPWDVFFPGTQEWQKSVFSYAKSIGLISSTYIDPNKPIIRGDIFIIIAKTTGLF